jgi:hypothetical protein
MLGGELMISGPLCRDVGVTPRKDANEHQRDDDVHEDERHEQERAASQILLRAGNGGREDRQVRQVAGRDQREQAGPSSIDVLFLIVDRAPLVIG